MTFTERISHWSWKATQLVSSPIGNIFAISSLLLYIIIGFFIGFSQWYNMLANTLMSAISYWLLFLLQSAQNRGEKAIQLKLDGLIRAIEKANNNLIGVEGLTENQIEQIKIETQEEVEHNN